MNHLGDTNKMVDTPRTDAAYTASTGAGIYELFQESKDIERELNAASKERDDALMMLGMYRMKSDEQTQRIKRLEEAYAAKDQQLSNLLHICRDNDIEVSSYDLIHGRKP